MADANIFSIKPTTRPGRSWTIQIYDTGETIIGQWDDGLSCIARHYNPEGGQNLSFGHRDEAIGDVFGWLADNFPTHE